MNAEGLRTVDEGGAESPGTSGLPAASPAPPDRPAPACLNCGAGRVGAYCHVCGQGDVDPDAPVSALVREGVQDALSWDHRVVRTLRVLVAEPGALAEAWAAGRRASFVAPLRLFLLVGAVLIALGVAHDRVADWVVGDRAETAEEGGADLDRMAAATREAFFWLGRTMRFLGLNALLLLTPLVGFAYFVLFNGRRPRLAHHLVHALHLAAFAVLGLIVWRLMALGWLATSPGQTLGDAAGRAAGWALLVWFAAVTVYAAASIRRFYGAGRVGAVLAAPLVVAVPLTVLFGVVFAIYLVLLYL